LLEQSNKTAWEEDKTIMKCLKHSCNKQGKVYGKFNDDKLAYCPEHLEGFIIFLRGYRGNNEYTDNQKTVTGILKQWPIAKDILDEVLKDYQEWENFQTLKYRQKLRKKNKALRPYFAEEQGWRIR